MAVQRFKEKEREEQRAIREQIREEEKARKEYEKAIKQAEREEETITKAIERARREYESANTEDRAKYEAKLQDLAQKLREAEEKESACHLHGPADEARGCLCDLEHRFVWGGRLQIGLTRRLEPMDRVRELAMQASHSLRRPCNDLRGRARAQTAVHVDSCRIRSTR